MRAVIERDTAVGTDGYNQQTKPNWQPHLSDVPCFAWTKRGFAIVDGEKQAVMIEMMMMVPNGTDVTDKDRIASVKDRRGTIQFQGPLAIHAVLPKQHHQQLLLKRVK